MKQPPETKPTPLLLMVERQADGAGGRPVVTLLKPMPRWLAWLCRRWQARTAGDRYAAADADRLFSCRYGIETTDDVFNRLIWPEAQVSKADAAERCAVTLVLTPPKQMVADLRSRELAGTNPEV